MDTLYQLQFACCIVTLMLALMLAYSRLQMRWVNARYERSRWLFAAAMLILSLHYVLQMRCGLRASGDDVGAAINILFYSPCVTLISLGIINVECGGAVRRRYFTIGLSGMALIYAVFLVGWLRAGSLHLGSVLYVLLVVFLAFMVYYVMASFREALRRRRFIEEQTAVDLLPYDRYTWSSLLLLCASALMLVGAVLSRHLLYVVGPLMLVALFVFVMSFIALGYNIMPVDAIVDDAPDLPAYEPTPQSAPEAACAEAAPQEPAMTDERVREIAALLQEWVMSGGFRDPDVNMPALSRRIHVARQELSTYFDHALNSSFRVWLSDVRFQEARRMLIENPHYSNEAISVECGFSSHAHLYKIFRTKMGMTPKMYKKSLSQATDDAQDES